MEQLTTRRRRAWISAISRSDLTDDKLEHERVCYRHFVSGQAAKQWEQFDVDWVPTLHLGHTKRLQRVLWIIRYLQSIQKTLLVLVKKIGAKNFNSES